MGMWFVWLSYFKQGWGDNQWMEWMENNFQSIDPLVDQADLFLTQDTTSIFSYWLATSCKDIPEWYANQKIKENGSIQNLNETFLNCLKTMKMSKTVLFLLHRTWDFLLHLKSMRLFLSKNISIFISWTSKLRYRCILLSVKLYEVYKPFSIERNELIVGQICVLIRGHKFWGDEFKILLILFRRDIL